MLKDNLPNVPTAQIGYYAGVVESVFAFVQFLTGKNRSSSVTFGLFVSHLHVQADVISPIVVPGLLSFLVG